MISKTLLPIYAELFLDIGKEGPAHQIVTSLGSTFCRNLDDKFKLSLHSPKDVPDLRNNYLTLKPGFEYLVLITPTATKSDDNIRRIDPFSRQCHFWDEFNSTVLFNNYTETGKAFKCCLDQLIFR